MKHAQLNRTDALDHATRLHEIAEGVTDSLTRLQLLTIAYDLALAARYAFKQNTVGESLALDEVAALTDLRMACTYCYRAGDSFVHA